MKARFYSITTVLIFILASMGNVQLAHANSAKDVRNLINAGSFQQAIDTANQKLSQNPKNLQLLLLKGQALVKLKKHKEADELYKGILKSFPKNPGARNGLANIAILENRYEEAIQIYKEIIKSHPNFSKTYENLGDAYIAFASKQYLEGVNQVPVDNTVQGLDKINRDDLLKSKARWSNTFNTDSYQQTQLAKKRRAVADASQTTSGEYNEEVEEYAETDATTANSNNQPKNAVNTDKDNSENSPSVKSKTGINQGQPKPAKTAKVNTTTVNNQEGGNATKGQNSSVEASNTPQQPTKAIPTKSNQTPGDAPLITREILAALRNWVDSWVSRDSYRYLSNYSREFRPDNNIPVSKWVEQKKTELAESQYIQVDIEKIKINVEDSTKAYTEFLENYESNLATTQIRKSLRFSLFEGKWLIVNESQIN